MRMRRKKHGAERIAACSEIRITPPEEGYIDLSASFPTVRPIHLEIGCGKGDFAVGMAAKHQETNFIAMERVPDVACIALEKAMAAKESRPDNLRILIGDARNLTEWFAEHSVDCIYLNFSDPWPKKGYAKRRLTHEGFLELYRKILVPHDMLKLKTDNQGLFDFSLEEFAASELEVLWQTRDLHASERAEGNVVTEYEEYFASQGMPIYSAIVRFTKRPDTDAE